MHRIRLHGIAALAFVLVLLGGCAAEYKLYSEEGFSASTDLAAACQFQWTTGGARYRLRDANGYGWGRADNFGHAGLESYLKELAPKCPDRAGTPRAQLSAHYVEYANRDNRSNMMLPVGLAELLTLGYMPVPMTNFYAACVETTTPAGPRRAAIAHGRIDSVTNVWGASESLLHPGGSMRRENRDELLRDLTLQAWHKLWTPGQGLVAGAGCRATLDEIVN